ncbi:hypothetical protein [Pseudomonas japonica]|uniref:Uncharacterized protein n=1 Tax=Pseudomonas japonica TaxID=256466 RepID=A0A239CZJ8_9PSED|nr:hypothetical protein [Pseudomonas japonica]SNS24974.1 hypothetical protein SAMN05444352_105119 [Pseudomonas japonica]
MATERDNQLSFKKTGITRADYQVLDHSITSGQPFDGVKTQAVSDGIDFDFYAGRKASKSNAEWFRNRANGGAAIATEDFDSWPSELNFVTLGNLTITLDGKIYVAENLLIAQGHSSRDRNNWWIASAKGERVVANNPIYQMLLVPFTGWKVGKFEFQAVIGQVSNFSMELITV